MNDAIAQELEHRLKLWQRLLDTGGVQRVKPQRLRELGVYGGAQGIWVDKARTRQLTPDGTGVSVGLLHTGTAYPDDLSHDGVLYHYPKTGRPAGRDRAEINSTKAAGRLGLPVYVVTPGPVSADRSVHLAWVEDWDDRSRLFLISFGGSRPQPPLSPVTDEDGPFELISKRVRRKTEREAREGQQRFKFCVLKRYGPSCAVCGIQVLGVLDAAHLCPKEEYGCDDPRNGLVLCAVHHRALDADLFAIHPETIQVHFRPLGPSASDLRITYPSLMHLLNRPHRKALDWRWAKWYVNENASQEA